MTTKPYRKTFRTHYSFGVSVAVTNFDVNLDRILIEQILHKCGAATTPKHIAQSLNESYNLSS